MILVEQILKKNIPKGLEKDVFEIEWYEIHKRIIRRKTKAGTDFAIRKKVRTALQDGDLLWYNHKKYVCIAIKPCDCIVISPANIREMGLICFHIGNMHLPIYIDEQQKINLAYDALLFDFLLKMNYKVEIQHKKLLHTLRGYLKA